MSDPDCLSLVELMSIHFDPRWGTEYWLERASSLPFDPLRDVQNYGDLHFFGPFPEEELRRGSVSRFVPRQFHQHLAELILSETGGATGSPKRVLFSRMEFEQGFIEPFLSVARSLGWPEGVPWLYLGPSGPHIIGKVVEPICRDLGSPPPFRIDFDPRWSSRLAPGSLARTRYLEHLTDQAMDVLDREEIGALFSTPPLLERIAERLDLHRRERILGVHYGGMAISPEQYQRFQQSLFPNAIHLSGYGNSLVGVAFEACPRGETMLCYYPPAPRHRIDLIPLPSRQTPLIGSGGEPVELPSAQMEPGETGQVMVSRLDATCFIPNLVERDVAEVAEPCEASIALRWIPPGIRNPRPAPRMDQIKVGFY